MALTRDRIAGMLAGAALGDALGAPYEFIYQNRPIKYTGRIEHSLHIVQRCGTLDMPAGSVTDDTEMTLALAYAICESSGFAVNFSETGVGIQEMGKIVPMYNPDIAIRQYMLWTGTGGRMMGKNTRALLKGVTTKKGFEGRYVKEFKFAYGMGQISEAASASNGILMRASPLFVLRGRDDTNVMRMLDAGKADCLITNPNPVNLECEFLYLNMFRFVMAGLDNITSLNFIRGLAKQAAVIDAIDQAIRVHKGENFIREMGKPKKGWVVNSFYCALAALAKPTLSEAMDWIIGGHPGSDTDTNACIAGALYGVKIGLAGFDARAVENFDKVKNVENGRPKQYTMHSFERVVDALTRIAEA